MKTHILIQLEVPKQRKDPNLMEKFRPIPVETRIRDAIEKVESGHPSHMEWRFLSKTYEALKKRKNPSEKIQALIRLIEPVMNKYGYHGVSAENSR